MPGAGGNLPRGSSPEAERSRRAQRLATDPPARHLEATRPIFTRPRARRLSLVPGVPAAAESQVRTRFGAGGSRIRTSGPSHQPSSAVLTPDAMVGHIRHVCFRRAPRINPARDSAIASGQPHPQRKGRSDPGLTPGAADAHLDHRLGPAPLPHAAR
jgi:hypothetical protein